MYKNTSRWISTLIVVFPPVILLVFALVTYTVFFNTQSNINSQIREQELNNIYKITSSLLETRVKSINNFINSSSKKESLNFLKNVIVKDKKPILIIDKNRILYSSAKKIDKKVLIKLKDIEGAYRDNELVAYGSSNNKYRWHILSYSLKKEFIKDVNMLQNSIREVAHKLITQSMIILAISWFGLLLLSLLLSLIVYNRLRKYEQALKKTNESIIFQSRQAMIGELLPMIAHQWRQPINKIASVLMKMRFELGSGNVNVTTLDRQAQQIEDSVELMSNTIDDFRTFYRPKEQAEEADIALLIRKAIYFLDELLERKKIQVKTDLQQTTAVLHANEFLQVIINLIKNAADAVDVNGMISITLRELDSDTIEVRVEDNGTGIPHDKLEKIFEPHESTKQGSMGLGLYMNRLIIENHFKGIIRAYNTPRGAGFLIRLPRNVKKEEHK